MQISMKSFEEYNSFYQDKFFDYTEPAKVIHFKAEGTVSFEALLYIPKKAPMNYYNKSFEKGLQLYSSGVMITEKCESLLPDHFSFVRGLVDSPDLKLNISRETPSLGLITTDCDDATYIALDAATKAAEVEVVYGRSFYAGAANASTPNAGEVIGILAGSTPGAVRSGMEGAISALERLGFEDLGGVPCLAHTVSSIGSFLAKEAGVSTGTALAYLIAPPLEGMYAMDAALKAADVSLCKLYAPPTETNFGGGLLSGTRSACEAACAAFREAVRSVATAPIE